MAAAEKNVLLIDLNAATVALYEGLGPDESEKLAAKEGDRTHFNEAGARKIADDHRGQHPSGCAGAEGEFGGAEVALVAGSPWRASVSYTVGGPRFVVADFFAPRAP